jgi:hypothetical protein
MSCRWFNSGAASFDNIFKWMLRYLAFPETHLCEVKFQGMLPQKGNIAVEWMVHPALGCTFKVNTNFRRSIDEKQHHSMR